MDNSHLFVTTYEELPVCTFPSTLASRLHYDVDEQLLRHASSAVFRLHFQDEVVFHGVIQWLRVAQYTYVTHHHLSLRIRHSYGHTPHAYVTTGRQISSDKCPFP